MFCVAVTKARHARQGRDRLASPGCLQTRLHKIYQVAHVHISDMLTLEIKYLKVCAECTN